jgi:hypothetical protein
MNLSLFKSKFIWIISIIIIIMGLLIYFIIHITSTGCPIGQKKYSECGNKCGPICTNGVYNCKLGCTSCSQKNESPCGDELCCPSNLCFIDDKTKVKHCCNKDQFCPTESEPNKCCQNNELCENGVCTVECGINTETNKVNKCISPNNLCVHAENMTDQKWNQFQKDFKDYKPYLNNNGKDAFVCATSKCKRNDTNNFPLKIDEFNPCTQLFNKYDELNNDIGYCTSTNNKPEDCFNCWTNGGTPDAPKKGCNGSNCIYKSLYTTKLSEITSDQQNIFSDYKQFLGKWCGPNSRSIIQFNPNNQCTVGDCWNTLGNLNGLNTLNWNDNTCTAVIDCDKNIPNDYNKVCNLTQPDICTNNDKILCNSNGDIRNKSSDTCNGTTCNTAISKGNKWCITNDGNIQTCIHDNGQCPDNLSQVLIDNTIICPNINNEGCDINKMIQYQSGAERSKGGAKRSKGGAKRSKEGAEGGKLICGNPSVPINNTGVLKSNFSQCTYGINIGGVVLFIENRIPFDLVCNGQGSFDGSKAYWCNESINIPKYTSNSFILSPGDNYEYILNQFTINFDKSTPLPLPYKIDIKDAFIGYLGTLPNLSTANFTMKATSDNLDKNIKFQYFLCDTDDYYTKAPNVRLIIYPVWMFPPVERFAPN